MASQPHVLASPVRNYEYHELLAMVESEKVTIPSPDLLRRHSRAVMVAPGPIDYWQGMIPLHRFDPALFSGDDHIKYEDRATTRTFRTNVYELLLIGRWLASHVLFEGDTSSGPYLSTTPSMESADVDSGMVIAWKQSNNGSSFVVMSRPMPHLVDRVAGNCGYPGYAWLEDGRVVTADRSPFEGV